ncbi:MAG: bacteriohemerythrin [Myxococcales bacterium FL481]|nr:MAG: bacteriohemerythrin [Myxococcales bacterium FL481]
MSHTMGYLDWTDALDVGVDAMNREHQRLIDLMNELHTGNERGENKAMLLSRLDKLAKWTVSHFSHEEAYLESIRYPKLTSHRRIHADLLRQLDGHVTSFRESDHKTLPKELFTFLKLWLTAHIQGIDAQYSPVRKSA